MKHSTQPPYIASWHSFNPQKAWEDLQAAITHHQQQLLSLLEQPTTYTWSELIAPIEQMDATLDHLWLLIAHRHHVDDNEALRSVYDRGLVLLTEHETWYLQHRPLYRAIKTLKKTPHFKTLSPVEQQVIEHKLRDFERTGVNLSTSAQKHVLSMQRQLVQSSAQFSHHVLDATEDWSYGFRDPKQTSGLPEWVIQQAKDKAQQQNFDGWILTLQQPVVQTVLKHANNRHVRREIYQSYTTRASDQGPCAGRRDNSHLIHQILHTRHRMARQLGFHNYTSYALATRTAQPEQVEWMLEDLTQRAYPIALKQAEELKAFANEHLDIKRLLAWDVAYASEKLRQSYGQLSEEQLRPYFPIDHVLSGLFKLVHRLFGITIHRLDDVDVWHPLVQCFVIYDKKQNLRGHFYTDLYARPGKRSGAWMATLRSRCRLAAQKVDHPIAALIGNFASPTHKDQQATLTHQDVVTLFHEFGHTLHEVLTQVDWPTLAGTQVAWDAVELPSQWMEQWSWEPSCLKDISKHVTTHEPLPDSWIKALSDARQFQGAIQLCRQLEFAGLDWKLHQHPVLNKKPEQQLPLETLTRSLQRRLRTTSVWFKERFLHSFTHVFDGGYAAGYYSYLWAEMFACDAFAAFKESGLYNPSTAERFLHDILETGGSQPMDVLFTRFRGRQVDSKALLHHYGLYTDKI